MQTQDGDISVRPPGILRMTRRRHLLRPGVPAAAPPGMANRRGCYIGLGTWILRGFVAQLAIELEDAAAVDGAALLQIHFRLC
jgi:ABC-type glycerol-3-phosphate transport system permease component